MSEKLEDLGSVKDIYNTGLTETDKGFKLPKKVEGVNVKKGQQLVRSKGQVRVATTEDKKVLKAQEKVAKNEIEAAKSEASIIIETAKAEALKIVDDAKAEALKIVDDAKAEALSAGKTGTQPITKVVKDNVPEKITEISETEK